MRDSLVIYKSTIDVVRTLSNKDRLKFYESLFDYALCDVEPENLDGVAKAFFDLTRPIIDSNNRKYKNGCKGGRPKDNSATENRKELGEDLELVNITEGEYEKLLTKYGDTLLDAALRELGGWLARPTANAENARGKSHYAYFRNDSWVMRNARERVKESGANWSV